VISTAEWEEEVSDRFFDDIWPVIFPAAALLALVVAWYMLRTGRDLFAFAASGAMIALLLISGAVGIFPNLLISSVNEDYNLTVDNSAGADNTLTICLVFAVIGMPLVLIYTAGVYYFFRGKTALGPDSY
jgi:cytochrome d ubiquinol oxidase subunit II